MLRSALLAKLSKEKKLTLSEPPSKRKSLSKPKNSKTKILTSKPFDSELVTCSEKFRLDITTLTTGLQALIKFTTENPKLQNRLFEDEDFPIYLQINTIKVPAVHPRILRLPLKHSLLKPDSEVCLIVADVQGVPNRDHERHLQHYETLLERKGVRNIKTVMTFHEFRTEYETFELKRRLVELFDVFLVDAKVSGKVVRKCGKIFYKKRKVPTAVKLGVTNLKGSIEDSLRKTSLYLHSKGDSFVVQIGHSKMKVGEMVENSLFVAKHLEEKFPGGFSNVRNLNLFTFRGICIPVYLSLKNQNEIILPKLSKQKEDAVEGELSTRLNSGVSVAPSGEVTLYQLNNIKRKTEDTDEKIVKKTK